MNWFGVAVISAAAVVAVTAAGAARQPKPSHPLVAKTSALGGFLFLMAATQYAVSVIINLIGAAGLSLFPAFAGLFTFAAGWISASDREDPGGSAS